MIHLPEYVSSLSQAVMESYQRPGLNVTLQNHIDPISLNIDTSVPIGIIINELMTNSLKHGFAERATGTIVISIRQENDQGVLLEYNDDGSGFPPGENPRQNSGLGMKLLFSIGEDQLQGKVEFASQNGVSYRLRCNTKLHVIRV